MPYKIIKRGDEWCVYKHDDNGEPVGDPHGCHASEKEATDQMQALYANTKETASEMIRETVNDTLISEFGGRVPSVPFAPGVDRDALEAGDPSPFYLVLPLSKEGVTSRNGLVHDADLGESIVRQIMTDKPGGIRGHIPDGDRATAFPVSAIHWVGATRVNGVTWGKGYIPRTMPELREEYRIEKAKRGRAATSIYGQAVREFVDDERRKWRAKHFDLEQIDLAPYKRAAAPGSGEFYITAEMLSGEPEHAPLSELSQYKEADMPDKAQVLAELTAEDIKGLPQFAALKDAIVAELKADEATTSQIAELTATNTAHTQRIAELEAAVSAKDALLAEFQQQQFDATLTAEIEGATNWQVQTDEGKAALASLRTVIRKMALASLGTVREMEKAQQTVTELVAGDLKSLVEMTRDRLAGPAVVVPAKNNRPVDGPVKIDESPEALAAAAAKFAFRGGN